MLSLVVLVTAAAGDVVGVPHQVGRIHSKELEEISGMVASRQNPSILWMHNDGGANEVFAVQTSGRVVGRVDFSAETDDVEDIAIGPGPEAGRDYLYVGDIGDNDEDRSEIRIFRFREPILRSEEGGQTTAESVEEFRLAYPDGSHDAETLIVDPVTGDLLIITKEKKRARVYVARADQLKDRSLVTLERVAKLKVPYVSGGDISRDGSRIVLRRESRGWLWNRQSGESVEGAMQRPRQQIPVRMKSQRLNGEAIAFPPEGHGYYTVSEGNRQPIGFFPLQKSK